MPQPPPEPRPEAAAAEHTVLIRLGAVSLIVFLLITGTALLLNTPVRSDPDRRDSIRTLVDINSATAAELAALPNIGPAIAARIAADRESSGPYESLDALDRVPGIGPRTIDSVRPYATAR